MGISEDEMYSAVCGILETHDLSTLTLRMTVSLLESRFKVDFSSEKPTIRALVDRAMNELESKRNQNQTNSNDDHSNSSNSSFSSSNSHSSSSNSSSLPTEVKVEPKSNSTQKRKRKTTKVSQKLSYFKKPVVITHDGLCNVVGTRMLSRCEVSQRIIKYAKEHELQDARDGRIIHCNDQLKEIFNVNSFTCFTLNKLIVPFLKRPEDCNESLQNEAKQMESQLLQELNEEEIKNGGVKERKKKKTKTSENGEESKRGAAFKVPYVLSTELQEVVGEKVLSRPDVVKKLWMYIKEHDLQDKQNRKMIICDSKLQTLFNGESTVSGFSMNKYLSAHLSRTED